MPVLWVAPAAVLRYGLAQEKKNSLKVLIVFLMHFQKNNLTLLLDCD